MASILVILAPGAEEIETLAVADILVRAGQRVRIASTASAPVVCGSRGLPLAAHGLLDDAIDGYRHAPADVIFLPGGMGSATTCRDDARVQDLIAGHLEAGRRLAVLCAAPIALVPRRLCQGRRLTSYPSVRSTLQEAGAIWVDLQLVEDGMLLTGNGPGAAFAFGLRLASAVAGPEVARQVAADMLITDLPTLHASRSAS